jgi:hypothetical protein
MINVEKHVDVIEIEGLADQVEAGSEGAVG